MTIGLPSSCFGRGPEMDIGNILRIVVLVLSTGVMLFGAAVIAGIFVPTTIPEQFRLLVGIVIVLYGAYRFVIALFRRKEAE